MLMLSLSLNIDLDLLISPLGENLISKSPLGFDSRILIIDFSILYPKN